MTEETASVSTEESSESTSVEQASTPETQESTAPKSLPADQAWDKVELNPEQQKRFNRLYAQVKQQEARELMIIEQNRALMDRLEKIEAEDKTTKHVSQLDQLKASRREALMSGDLVKADELDEQIFELRTNKPQPKPVAKQEEATLDPAIQQRIVTWANEVDADGDMIRPFMLPGHPKHKASMALIESVLQTDELYGKDVEDYVVAVDRALESAGYIKSKRKMVEPSPVLQSSGQPRTGKAPDKLTGDEVRVAKLMYRDDPDPLGRYRKAKDKLR